ncbi:MAG: hypothetical protein ACOCWO_01185 [Candidatus Muiribacteriaceae bacterium]
MKDYFYFFETLDNYSDELDQFIKEYTYLHKKISEDRGVIRFFKNAFGMRNNFQELAAHTEKQVDELREFARKIDKLIAHQPKTEIQKEYAQALKSFTNILINLLQHLVTMAEFLYNIRIDNANICHYDYKKLKSEYKDSAQAYQTNHIHLRDLYHKMHEEAVTHLPKE